ncbi:SH3 and multiple ankyrin repeat domains protein 3-like isoform X1 [Amphibalanus amphitrite]|uniref:SH3 and multiple ankyrin repeat domains protein 3-like isoform X1 n=1 Tax=Amphibalanus amphitrite TaxID=1232801 RepID=UPI001C9213B0|nr:SH3 and multiple ankyrin repeat domains protein 3-like isoform X1 [Amphibalanus amphitrite]XP_043229027.1 SH3 and multiple ankyrin repeat domains protein 3-like isoform X1 [Amphibalanus amphitrite]
MEDDLSVTSDELIFIRICVPELSVEKCLQFCRSDLVWDVKQQCLRSLPKELKESFNYGLFYPPQNGKAGKFLDEARPIADYPFAEPVGCLELKYKRRVYKMLKMDERQLRAAHSRANLRRIVEHVLQANADKVAKLCAKGLDPNFHCPETGETPLTLTAKLKSPSRVILTLVNGGALVDYRTVEGATALHKAVERNNFEALKTLLDLGASPNYQDAKGLTPLYYSIVHNADASITQALLHDHATIGARDCQGWAEVHQAARRSMTQHLEHLLFYGADMNLHNASGNTPLHVCAINGEEACARVLLFRGADREALNFANQTPYQVAVIAGNLELAEIIQRHRPEDIVPFKEAPKYNPRRRSGLVLPRTHSESRLGSPLSKPPSPSPSNRSLPPFSSASSLSETSTGSSGTCTQPTSEAEPPLLHGKDLFDVVSESSGVGTSNGSGSGESVPDTAPEAGLVQLAAAGATVVCMEPYSSPLPGHLTIAHGDIIEVSASTDHGMLEGCLDGQLGVFPARCVQEVRLRKSPPVAGPARPPAADEPPYGAAGLGCSLSTPYGTAPRQRRPAAPLQPRTVVLHRSAKGFGFVLRGAKSSSPLMELRPSERCPALQYLDDVDPGGVAERAGLKKWDFILAINGVDVAQESHELVVEQIRRAGDLVAMTVVSLPDPSQLAPAAADRPRQFCTLPRHVSAGAGRRPPVPPLPPKRDPKTTLSVGRARARSLFNNYPEIDALDRAIHDYDSEGRSTNSSSVDSETYKVPSAGVQVASIRTRPASSRLTSRELEELFARQGSAPRYPPTAGQGGPRVYASVAEMKRHKGKKPKGGPLESVYVGDSGSLSKAFHSTPDLQSAASWMARRRSHSQEDLHALQHGPGARLAPRPAWSSSEHLYGRARRASTDTASETSDHSSSRGGVGRRMRQLKLRGRAVAAGASAAVLSGGAAPAGPLLTDAEYAVPPPIGDGSARRVPSTFRPSSDAKLYASPTELKTLAFHDGAAPMRSRLQPQQRSRSVPPPARDADRTDQPLSDETTPTNAAPPSELYARPLRRSTSQPADEELPPPPPAALLKPPPSPRSSHPAPAAGEQPARPSPPPAGGGSNLQTLLAEKVAERRRRLSVGDVRGGPAGAAPPPAECPPARDAPAPAECPPARDALAAGDRVQQVTRIQVGKKQMPSGIPSPTKTVPQGMTKSHTIGTLSGTDLRSARAKLRSARQPPGLPGAAPRRQQEEADSSSSGVSSDQDQAQPPKYVTFIPTEGGSYTRRRDDSGESESSDDTSDRTWILSSERGGPPARPAAAAPPTKSSSIPCLSTAHAKTAAPTTPPASSLSSSSGAAKPVSITVPGGRPARQRRQLRFGGTTTVVITGSGAHGTDTEAERHPAHGTDTEAERHPAHGTAADDERSIEDSLREIEQHVSQLGGGAAAAAAVVPPPPGFGGDGLLLAPPPEFSDPAGHKAPAPRPPPKPAAESQSRLVKPRSLAVRSRSPAGAGTSPPAALSSPSGAGSVTAGASPARASSGIPRPDGARRHSAGSPSKIPAASRPRPAAGAHVKNRFRTVPVSQWSVEDTADWLESLFMPEYKARFAEAEVDGARLLQLDGPALAQLGVKRMGHRLNIEKSLKRLTVAARVGIAGR